MHLLLPIAALVYLTRLSFFWLGQWKSRRQRKITIDDVPFVSIVVPARNEESTIRACVESLVTADYPSSRREIIIVDDRSTDSTGAIIDALAQQYGGVRALHRSDADAFDNLRGKPGALQFGIDQARGEILLLTDADCRVHPLWLRTMSAPFHNPNLDLVCSFTTVRQSSPFAVIQDVEWLYSSSMAQAATINRQPLGCYGNNMAVRTSAFRELGGYRGIPFSVTEDLALMQALASRGSRIEFLCDEASRVETEPSQSLGEYLRQKQRWVQGGLELGWRGFTFAATSVLYWAGLVIALVNTDLLWIGVFIGLRFIGDGLLVASSAIRLRRRNVLPVIGPILVLLLLLELLLPILAFNKRVVWKGQTFGR